MSQGCPRLGLHQGRPAAADPVRRHNNRDAGGRCIITHSYRAPFWVNIRAAARRVPFQAGGTGRLPMYAISYKIFSYLTIAIHFLQGDSTYFLRKLVSRPSASLWAADGAARRRARAARWAHKIGGFPLYKRAGKG